MKTPVVTKTLATLAGALALGGSLLFAGLPARAADNELYFYDWSNYFPPELLKKFESETGIKVTIDTFDTNEAPLAKLQAGGGGYDVVRPGDFMVKILAEEGLLQEIDAPSLSNWKNVKPSFQHPWYDVDRKYSIPGLWGTTGFVYDSTEVSDVEESWKDFFDPRPELVGKIAAIDDEQVLYRTGAYYLGIDPCTEDPGEAQKILDLLLAQKPKLKLYSQGGGVDRMLAHEVVLHQFWNGPAHRVKQQLPSVVYVYPKEGLEFWADSYVVPKDAPHPENAKIFLNWLLVPENAAAVSNFTGYANAVDGAEPFLDPSLASDPAVNTPPEYYDRLREVVECSPAARDLNSKVWVQLKK